MRRLMLLAAGGAVGYVLGTRAGRPAYDRMTARWRRMTQRTGLAQTVEAMTGAVQDLGDAGLDRARSTVGPLGQEAVDAMDRAAYRMRDQDVDVSDRTAWTAAGSRLEE